MKSCPTKSETFLRLQYLWDKTKYENISGLLRWSGKIAPNNKLSHQFLELEGGAITRDVVYNSCDFIFKLAQSFVEEFDDLNEWIVSYTPDSQNEELQ